MGFVREGASIDRRPIVIQTDAPTGANSPTWYTAAWLTVPDQNRRPELQILVHGANSDHRYWDFPLEGERYSYVQWARERGMATLMVDRIGSGMSSHPPGAEATIEAQADTLRQLVKAVRNGLSGAPQFSRIILVGASLGSVVCGVEAATFGDVDAVVLTAYMPVDQAHGMDAGQLAALFGPAVQRKPELRGLVDDDYVAPLADVGESWLYHEENVDQAIVSTAEQLSGTTTLAELEGAADAGPVIRKSQMPTLVLVGQFDPLMFDQSAEEDCVASARRLSNLCPSYFAFRVMPDAGHPLNLHRTAHDGFQMISDWIDDLSFDEYRHPEVMKGAESR